MPSSRSSIQQGSVRLDRFNHCHHRHAPPHCESVLLYAHAVTAPYPPLLAVVCRSCLWVHRCRRCCCLLLLFLFLEHFSVFFSRARDIDWFR